MEFPQIRRGCRVLWNPAGSGDKRPRIARGPFTKKMLMMMSFCLHIIPGDTLEQVQQSLFFLLVASHNFFS